MTSDTKSEKTFKSKRLLRRAGIVIVTPIALFLLLAILIYLPPVQRFVVDKVTASLSESMKMRVSVGGVRLAFPLDLALHEVSAVDGRDTVLYAGHLRLNVEMLPLFEGVANVEGFELYDARLATKGFIADTEIRGKVGSLTVQSRGIRWQEETIDIQRARLANADLQILLSDTAQTDTTPGTAKWKIRVAEADMSRTAVDVRLPHDSMRVALGLDRAKLTKGNFDLGQPKYAFSRLWVTGAAVRYDLPYMKKAEGGFDASHIQLTGLMADVQKFSYGAGGALSLQVVKLALREQSGLMLSQGRATLQMDSTQLYVPQFLLVTPTGELKGNMQADLNAFTPDKGGQMQVSLQGRLGKQDWLPFVPLDKTLADALPTLPILLETTLRGNMKQLRLERLKVEMPGVLAAQVSGDLTELMAKNRQGRWHYGLSLKNPRPLLPLLKAVGAQEVQIPSGLRASGDLRMAGETYGFTLDGRLGSGRLRSSGQINMVNDAYRLKAVASDFPIARFLSNQPLQPFSGRLQIEGHGFDVFSSKARLHADVAAERLRYGTYNLDNIKVTGTLSGGKANFHYVAHNENLEGEGQLEASLGKHGIEGQLSGKIPYFDLHGWGLVTDTMQLGTDLDVTFAVDRKGVNVKTAGTINNILIMMPSQTIMSEDILMSFEAGKDTTYAQLSSGDLVLQINAHGGIQKLSHRLGRLAEVLQKQIANKYLDQQVLKRELPKIDIALTSGRNNPLCDYLSYKGLGYRSAFLSLTIDPNNGINGLGALDSVQRGKLLVDDVKLSIIQDEQGIMTELSVDNMSKRNPNRFTANVRGMLLPTGFSVDAIYRDKNGKEGLKLGVKAEVSDSGYKATLYPEKAIIAYRTFTINEQNYIFLHNNKKIEADVDLLADDGTGLQIYNTASDDPEVNDITLGINNLNLGDLSAVIPYMPQLSGLLSGDIHLIRRNDNLTSSFSAQIADMGYEGVGLGNLGVDGALFPQPNDVYFANLIINRDNTQVGIATGAYDASGDGTFNGSLELDKFPLNMVNGFMEGTDFALAGTATGTLNVEGGLSKPQINGSVKMDSVHILSPVYGVNLKMEERELAFENNRLKMDNIKFTSYQSKTPLTLDGYIDLKELSNVGINLAMNATNYELINTKRQKESTVFGRLLVNFKGLLSGQVSHLDMRGLLTVLDDTNLGYIMKDTPLSGGTNLKDLVTFMSFEDSVVTTEEVTPANVTVALGITIDQGANVYCDLGDGESYVNMEGGGQMAFKYLSGEMILTGRYTINNGEMKYAMPVIPLKTFEIESGSSVDFTGDPINPKLNITAVEKTKASVSDGSATRNVQFNVGIVLSQDMKNLGLNFTLEAPQDLTVQNQLAAMTADQRAKLAVTMLATGMYLADDNSSGFNANNALNAFLQSEIQNIAGNALKTIDISFGVQSGSDSEGNAQTDYSFRFAKRFWGDRLAVIIGGTLSTGNSTSTQDQSFIDNVSLEYRLDKSGTRYVTVFYNRDTKDPLEGEYTVTGASLVLRRKTNNLGELFIFRRKKQKGDSSSAPSTPPIQ